MGIFSFLKDAAIEANEDAHGARLLTGVQSSFATMESLEGQVQFVAMAGYLEIRERLINEIPNFSREGRIKLGRTMQDQARSKFDIDMSGSYAKWLAGAWLESKERDSLKAQQAFGLLEGFADYVHKEVLGKPTIVAHDPRPPISINRTEYSKSHTLSCAIRRKRLRKYSLEFQSDIHSEQFVTILDLRYKCPHEWIRPAVFNKIIGVSFPLDGGSEKSLDFEFSSSDGVTECYGDQIELTIEVGGLVEIMIFQNKSSVSPDFGCVNEKTS